MKVEEFDRKIRQSITRTAFSRVDELAEKLVDVAAEAQALGYSLSELMALAAQKMDSRVS